LAGGAALACGAAFGRGAVVTNYENQSIGQDVKLTPAQIKQAIISGAASKGWSTQPSDGDKVMASYNKGKRNAAVNITFTATSYSIRYADSQGLKYTGQDGAQSINPMYNTWVSALKSGIENSLRSTPSSGVASASSPAARPAPIDTNFSDTAAAYRAAFPKPQITEEVRKLKLQAEVMIREKRFGDAAQLYEDALRLAPWWPDGRYNRALVLAELKQYDEAAGEMNRFLLLEPESNEARALRDQIYKWEVAAKAPKQ